MTGAWSRRIYIETPANCYANHQSNVRFWAKMGLVVGLASRIAEANGLDRIPAVREELGRLAALEATIGGLVAGQIEAWEEWPAGFATPNRRMMYAALNWCQENHTGIVDALRTLLGGVPLQMPASFDVLDEPQLKDRFERWWKTPNLDARRRMKLYKLAWDLVGSEFAGRHQLYEKFYAGNSIVVRNQSDREAPWQKFHAIVDGILDSAEEEILNRLAFTADTSAGRKNLDAPIEALVIAGWTGRDAAAVEEHIAELERVGVRRPKTAPIFYRAAASLLTTGGAIEVAGGDTSGEVEPVVVSLAEGLFVGVGSDHTDRKAEAQGVSRGKAAMRQTHISHAMAL